MKELDFFSRHVDCYETLPGTSEITSQNSRLFKHLTNVFNTQTLAPYMVLQTGLGMKTAIVVKTGLLRHISFLLSLFSAVAHICQVRLVHRKCTWSIQYLHQRKCELQSCMQLELQEDSLQILNPRFPLVGATDSCFPVGENMQLTGLAWQDSLSLPVNCWKT